MVIIAPEVATQKATLVAARIVRMRAVRERVRDDRDALATVRSNLRTATEALRVFNRARKGRPLA